MRDLYEDIVTPVAARRVLGALGESKWETWPGSFTTALVIAFCKADSVNFARLQEAFPAEGAAMYLYKQVLGGVDTLRAIADRPDEEDD